MRKAYAVSGLIFEIIKTCKNDPKKVPIGEYLEYLPENFNPQAGHSFKTKNYQSFELGLDHLNNNEDYIKSSLKTLEGRVRKKMFYRK